MAPSIVGGRERVRATLARRWEALMRSHGVRGQLARAAPTDSMMLWTAVLLALVLVLYYL
jgi:hypothetical protein